MPAHFIRWQWLQEKAVFERSIQRLNGQVQELTAEKEKFNQDSQSRETRFHLLTDTVDQLRVVFATNCKELQNQLQEARKESEELRAALLVSTAESGGTRC
jgi:predicted  nucleic acid-binding Zn-ribbon protein